MNNESENPMPQMPPDVILSQMLWGGLVQQCVCVAAKLGIPDLLAEKPQTAAALAVQTETHSTALYRVLRLLTSVGVFGANADGEFSLTPLSEMLRSDVPHSMRDMAIMLGDHWTWDAWGETMHSVKTGEVAHEKVQGMGTFEFFQKDEAAGTVFNRAMTNLSQMVVPAVVAAYDFSAFSKLVDIAGGHGFLLSGILKANPHLQGVLFDLPYVIASAGELLEKEGVKDRVELVSGDFFKSVAPGADAYLLKHIIHDWDDEQSVEILKNIHSAMNDGGKVLLVEMVVPETSEPSPSKILDIQMLLMEGGMERTAEEYRRLLDAAGFSLTRIVPTRSPYSIVEAIKS